VYLQGNAAARPAVAELLLDTGARLLDDDLRQAAVVLASVVYGAAMRNEKVPRPGLPPAGRPGATPAGGVPGSP
jgi:hypothetical protein